MGVTGTCCTVADEREHYHSAKGIIITCLPHVLRNVWSETESWNVEDV